MLKRLISTVLLVAILFGLLPSGWIAKAEAVSASTSTVTSLFEARSQGVHPRILANHSDFARIRRLIQTDPYMKSWYAQLYDYGVEKLGKALCQYELTNKKLLSVSREASYRIAALSMLYHLSGEARFADRAVEEMLNVCAFSDWNPSHYLDVGQMAYGVGLGYDWLYHYMTSSQRSTICKAIYNYAISTRKKDLTRITSTSNWNPWCNNGLIIAACAIFESYPSDAAATISDSVSYLPNAISVMAPSGSYPEGPYYDISSISIAMAISCLTTVLGTDFGLSDLQGLEESGKFLLAVNGYTNTFNHGDGTDGFMINASLHWYASRYHMPELSVFQREHHVMRTTFDTHLCMLWYDPELVEGVTTEDMQLDYLLMNDRYVSVASFRSFPGDAHQIYAAIKSGNNQMTSHGDLDIGTFVMEAMGERWFLDLGKDAYTNSNYFDHGDGGTRWTYYRKRTEGHNTIVINPSTDGGQVFDAKCQITDYQSAYDGGYATVNMKNAYSKYGANKALRSIALFDNRTRVRLRDEIVCSSASTIYWFAHTQADISISSDGKTANLTQNGKTLIAQIASPSEAKFTKMGAKPLSSSPNPSSQNANEGVQKLVIKLTNTTSASISVFFTPILSEADKGKSLPTYSVANTGSLLKSYASGTTLTANQNGVYEIYDAEQLMLLSKMVADGDTFEGKTVRMMRDIDLKGRSFVPIGGNGSDTSFKGTFDGNEHVVKNLLIFKTGGNKIGFFGNCSGATIQNFGIESGTIFGGNATAGLMGYGYSVTVENCFNRANIIASEGNGGGLIGQLTGTSTIRNCYNHGYVKCSGSIAGGIVGYISSKTKTTIENCYHAGELTDSANKTGMIGYYNTGSTNTITSITVKNCRSTVAMKSSSVADSSSLETYTDNATITDAQMVSVATTLGKAFLYDCEWENNGYPVLAWECDTVLPEDLVLTNSAQLRLLAYMVCSGTFDFSGKTVRLGKDIDLASREWTPIGGNNTTDAASTKFAGTFDGQGYRISNLSITTKHHYVGFFGATSGKILNLGIDGGRVVGGSKAAGLVGSASGTISGCYSCASVSSTNLGGGLVGMSSKTTIENSYARATVYASNKAGGLVGSYSSSSSNSTVTNCYAACTLSGGTVGGLIGLITSAATGITITNAYALNTYSLVGSSTSYTEINCATLSAADLKAKASSLGKAFTDDSYVTKNGGYPITTVSAYKSSGMKTLTANEAGEYVITTADELRRLAYMVNIEKNTFAGKTVRLCSDIDLQCEEWIPIGGNSNTDGTSARRFSGTFEGDGHTVSNLTITAGNYYVGFFGDLTGATIRNFGIQSGVVVGQAKVGGMAGTIRSNVLIENCFNKANVDGSNIVGGIVGMSSGKDCTIINCYNTGSVTSAGKAAGILGYIAGSTTNTTVQNCYNTGTQSVGILASAADSSTGTVKNCYTIDSVSAVDSASTITVSSTKKLSLADLRSSASTLGTAFEEDYFVQNRLNPVLSWENGDSPTELTQTNGVYEIRTADDLRLLSYLVRQGNTFGKDSFILTTDLDMEGRPWLPIGGKDSIGSYAFGGNFDGRGRVIRNVNANELELGYASVFGLTNNCTIENLGVEDSTFIGCERSAALVAVAQNRTVIRNCYNKSLVYGKTITGGIIGMVSGVNIQLENCYNTGDVFTKIKSTSCGGLIGSLASTTVDLKLTNCYDVGTYFGILGSASESATGSAENCYSVSAIKLANNPRNINLTSAKQISADTLRGYAAVLGEAFTADAENVNNGYPVLTWQNAEHCFHQYTTTSDGAETHSTVCALCGDRITEAHKFGDGVVTKTATCTEDGVLTYTCDLCKETRNEGIPTTGHSYIDGICACGAKEIVEPILDESIKILHTLDLASDISVTFAVEKTALANYDSYYLECVLPEYNGNTLVGTSTVEVEPVVSGNYYYFTLTGITAVGMGDMVDAVLHMIKGEQKYYSKTDSYSVATYAYGMLNSSKNAKMLTLCADLLRYGAEAQRFKGYRTDALVDADMTEIHRSYLSDTETLSFTATDSYLDDLANPTITWVGKTLDLGSKVGMKFVFNAKNYSGDLSKLSMKVSYQGSTGETKTVTVTGIETYNAANKQYSFTFYGLLASELRIIVDVAIYESDTQLSETLRYSAESYAAKTGNTTLESLTKALFAYSDSAKVFFTK